MKIVTQKTAFKLISLIVIFSTSLVLSININKDKQDNTEAMTYSNGKQETGLSFGMGTNGGYSLINEKGFRKVETVKILPAYKPIPRGEQIRADENPTNENYYDGEIGLNSIKINCKVYKDPIKCTQVNSCGWCHAQNRCIAGNSMGPLEECPRSKYQFSWPGGVETPTRVVNNEFNDMVVRTFERK